MPKSKKKTKHLETKGDKKDQKNEGDVTREKAPKPKKSRTQRFLARLQRVWTTLTSCKGRRRKSKKYESPSDDVPGPSSIGLRDKKVYMTSDRKVEPEDGKGEDLSQNHVVKPILHHYQETQDQIQHHGCQETEKPSCDVGGPRSIGPMHKQVQATSARKETSLSYEEQQILLQYNQDQEQILSHEDIYVQYYGQQETQDPSSDSPGPESISLEDEKVYTAIDWKKTSLCYIEEQILLNYHQIQGQIQSHEDLYVQYYDGLDREKDAGEEEEDSEEYMTPEQSQGHSRCHKEKSENVCLEMSGATFTQKTTTTHSQSQVPLTLKSFTFHARLGKGGFGEVLSATDVIQKEQVAIKVVRKDLFIKYECTLVERDILRLSHQNHFLVHGLAAFQTKNCVYYVMELATRGSLYDLVKKNSRLDYPTSRFITAEIICGLRFLHDNAIIHRDLKALNILLTRDGHIKICDFGLSITGVHETTTDYCRGTPGMAAPEMFMGMEYGRGVDYFSLGVTLFHMTTGYFPFCGSTVTAVEAEVIWKTPFIPRFLPPETCQILYGLLCKDSHKRLGVRGDIRTHPFFSGVNWNEVENRTTAPPNILVSPLEDPKLTQNLCYKEDECSVQSQKPFEEFSFVCPAWSDTYHTTNVELTTDWADVLKKWLF